MSECRDSDVVGLELAADEHVSRAAKAVLRQQLRTKLESVFCDVDEFHSRHGRSEVELEPVLSMFPRERRYTMIKWLTDASVPQHEKDLLIEQVSKGVARTERTSRSECALCRIVARFEDGVFERVERITSIPREAEDATSRLDRLAWYNRFYSVEVVLGLLTLAAATSAVLLTLFTSDGCCGATITGLTEHFDEAVHLCENLDDDQCGKKWEDHYNLTLKTCPDLQRSANCSVECKEGHVWSNADLIVGRSKIFTCSDDYSPKWNFVSWPAPTVNSLITGPEIDTCHDKSWFTSEKVCQPKVAHPHCWLDPCWSPMTKDNPLWTACGDNTRCERYCEGGVTPSVPDKGGQALCGIDSQPYNVKYPSQKNCSCYDDHYVPIKDSQGNPDWSQGCNRTQV